MSAAPSPDLLLSTGRVVAHRRDPNGSQTAYIRGSDDEMGVMTDAEWAEYCAWCRAESARVTERIRVHGVSQSAG